MDEKDLQIIELLERDARTPYLEIAKRMRMSESAVRKRIRKLEEQGIIERYTTIVNPLRMGYGAVALVGIDTTPEKYLEVIQNVAQMKEVKRMMTTTGDHMIMAEVWARDNRELTEILTQKIGKLEGVTKVCPAIILERVKA